MDASVAPKSKLPTKMFFTKVPLVFDCSGEGPADGFSAELLRDDQRLFQCIRSGPPWRPRLCVTPLHGLLWRARIR
jgi:hypothetical protein